MSSFKDQQTILFLAANPKGTNPLRIDQELRDIAEGLQRAQKRDQFNLEQRLAVRPRDIHRAMLDVGPQIIHFAGHGAGEQGLFFEDDIGNAKLVNGAALAELFEMFADQVNCVVLNGCYSEVQAKAIVQHISYVIGMNQAIGDKAAIEFAVGFYDALGAGRTIKFAYKLGCSAIRMAGIAEHLTPVLLERSTTEEEFKSRQASVVDNNLGIRKSARLTSRQRQDLTFERAGLQRRYDLLSQKIQRLGEALDIENDPATRFKLEIQLQQCRTERDPIGREITELDSKLEE